MKFRIGDRVRNITNQEKGKIVGITSDGDHFMLYDKESYNSQYYFEDIGKHYSEVVKEDGIDDIEYTNEVELDASAPIDLSEMELLTIPDSKLARNLYKNQILEIKDNKIYLK